MAKAAAVAGRFTGSHMRPLGEDLVALIDQDYYSSLSRFPKSRLTTLAESVLMSRWSRPRKRDFPTTIYGLFLVNLFKRPRSAVLFLCRASEYVLRVN
jgi:hypothetical protein